MNPEYRVIQEMLTSALHIDRTPKMDPTPMLRTFPSSFHHPLGGNGASDKASGSSQTRRPSYALLRQLALCTGFAWPSDSSQLSSGHMSDIPGHRRPSLGPGQQCAVSMQVSMSMPDTIAWHGMHPLKSVTHPESPQSCHYYSWLTSASKPLPLEQQRLDSEISNFRGSGALGLQPSKMEPGQMIVSSHLFQKT